MGFRKMGLWSRMLLFCPPNKPGRGTLAGHQPLRQCYSEGRKKQSPEGLPCRIWDPVREA